MVLRGQLENPSPTVTRALSAYRKQDSHGVQQPKRRHRTVKSQKRLSEREIDEAIAGYEAGATLRQLGTQFDVSRHTISKHLRARGIQLRLSSLTPDEIEEAKQLYAQGLSLARVGQHFNRDASLIHLTLRRAGVQCRDPQGRDRPTDAVAAGPAK